MKIKTLILTTAITALLCACGSSKKLADNTGTTATTINTGTTNSGSTGTTTKPDAQAAAPIARFVSDIDLDINFGDDSYSLGGKLWLKRDEVVRLNLTFMGFIEVGTIEFTPDNILIINRIGKEYTKMPYNASDILVKNNITFSNIQQLACEKLYSTDGKSMKDTGLDTALADMLNSNLKNGKKVSIRLEVGKPDTKRDFDSTTSVKSSYTEVPAQLLIAKLMSIAK